MTPRERIISALEHTEPDRVPVDLGGTDSSGIMGTAYDRLKKHLGISIIYVTHNIAELIKFADRIAILSDGKIIQIGELKDIKKNPKNNLVKSLIAT